MTGRDEAIRGLLGEIEGHCFSGAGEEFPNADTVRKLADWVRLLQIERDGAVDDLENLGGAIDRLLDLMIRPWPGGGFVVRDLPRRPEGYLTATEMDFGCYWFAARAMAESAIQYVAKIDP